MILWPRLRPIFLDLITLVLVMIVSVISFFNVSGLKFSDLSGYWGFYDLIFGYGVAKTVGDTGLLLFTPNLGVPFGSDLANFPSVSPFWTVFIYVIQLFVNDPIVATNLMFVASFPIAGAAMYMATRNYFVRRSISAVAAVAFTMIPYHFDRVEHPGLASYWVIPLFLMWFALVFRLKSVSVECFSMKAQWIHISILSFLIAANEGYYFIFLMLTAAIVALFKSKELIRSGQRLLSILGLILPGLFFFLFLILQKALATVPLAVPATVRTVTEQYYYANSLLNFFTDATGSTFGFGFLSEGLLEAIQSEPDGPGGWQTSINLFTAVSSTFVLLVILAALFRDRRPKYVSREIRILSGAWLITALFAVYSGLGLVVGVFLSPQIRVWGRMAVVSAALSILALALFLEYLQRKEVGGRKSLVIRGSIIFFLAISLLNATIWNRPLSSDNQTPRELKSMMNSVESSLEAGCSVLNIRPSTYPDGPDLEKMVLYDPVKPYLASNDLKFSYGAVKGQVGATWIDRLSTDPNYLVVQARDSGFCGILLDTFGYPNPGDWVYGLTSILGSPIVSESERWQFFTIDPAAELNETSPLFTDPALLLTGGVTSLQFTEDFTPVYRSLGGEIEMFVTNPYPDPRNMVLKFDLWGEFCSSRVSIFGPKSKTVFIDVPLGQSRLVELPLLVEARGSQAFRLVQNPDDCLSDQMPEAIGVTVRSPSIAVEPV